MKRTACVIAFLLLALTAQAVPVDDFEGYSLGDVDVVTGGAWVESPTSSSTGMTIIQDDQGNQVLGVGNENYGSVGVYGTLSGDEIIATGETRTLFTRFYISGTSGTYDVSFGLTGVNVPTTWSNYASYFTVVNGNFNVRQGSINTTVASMTAGKWYYVWLVVNNSSYTHTCYLKDVAEDATSADMVAENWGMRNTTSGNLDRLFGMTNTSNYRPVYFDNISITDDVSLDIPPDVPVPPVIVSDPNDVVVNETQAASFETVFTSGSTPSATWYKVASPSDLVMDPNQSNIDVQLTYNEFTHQFTSTLSMTGLVASDSGQYYCRIINNTGLPQNSAAADLVVYGLVAHWTLDLDDFVSGQYLDVTGGYDATAHGTPAFVAGADGSANGAVQITPTTGWATVTGFNPGTTGEMTVSVWAYWQEPSIPSDDVRMKSLPGGDTVTVDDGLKSNDHWQQICAVFNGSQGKVYVDGKLRAQGAWTLPADMTSLLDIGSTDSGNESFNGAMDDLRIYNYAMTDTQVADIYYAITHQGVCISGYTSQFDVTGPEGQPDCIIDLYDLVAFANQWLGLYDYSEFAEFSSDWLSCYLYPDCNP